MTTPELWIVFPYEGTPRAIPNAEHEGDLARLVDWLSSGPYRGLLAELVPGWCGVATGAGRVSPDEELELAALCGYAWERRHYPEALRAAVDAITDWWDRRSIRAYERRQRSRAALVQLLRETRP
jgi:hypothetical protein